MIQIYLKHAPNPLEATICLAEIIEPCAPMLVGMHKVAGV